MSLTRSTVREWRRRHSVKGEGRTDLNQGGDLNGVAPNWRELIGVPSPRLVGVRVLWPRKGGFPEGGRRTL